MKHNLRIPRAHSHSNSSDDRLPMHVFNIEVPDMRFDELSTYAQELKNPHLRGVFMRDALPRHQSSVDYVIVNFNTSNHAGSN